MNVRQFGIGMMRIEQSMGHGVITSTVSQSPNPVRVQPAAHVEKPVFDTTSLLIRCLDILFAGAGLIFIMPLMAVVALVCWLQDRGPPVYAQSRRGASGNMFPCLKFRSMVVDAEARLADLLENDPDARAEWETFHKLANDPRITPFGSFLRKSSIDELPQLLNVVLGTMSLVGPRPIVPGEVSRYGRYISVYDSVRPGLTGLWQISGRSNTQYSRRIALDVLFIRRRSVKLYLYIVFSTIPAVLMRRGAV